MFLFQSQSLLQEFIDFIKQMKVVVLEDLGAQFNIRTQVRFCLRLSFSCLNMSSQVKCSVSSPLIC